MVGVVMLLYGLTWPSPTRTSALWSAGETLCRMLPILLCIFTVLGFSCKFLQGPTCGWSFPQSFPTADSCQGCGPPGFPCLWHGLRTFSFIVVRRVSLGYFLPGTTPQHRQSTL